MSFFYSSSDPAEDEDWIIRGSVGDHIANYKFYYFMPHAELKEGFGKGPDQ